MSFASFRKHLRAMADAEGQDKPRESDVELQYYESLGFELVRGNPVVIGESYEVSGYTYYASLLTPAWYVYRKRVTRDING